MSASKIILHVLVSVVVIAMDAGEDRKVLAQFKDENGILVKAPFDIPINITPNLLQSLCNALVEEVKLFDVIHNFTTLATCRVHISHHR